jgi:sialidase-1
MGTSTLAARSLHPFCVVLILAFVAIAAATDGSSVVFNLEPAKEFPRNSEGAFITLKDGRLLFLYTQFYGGAADHSAARIVSITSGDGGRVWDATPRAVVENHGAENVMSVSLLRLSSGRIALFYLVKNSWLDCRPHVQFSDDEAATWTEPKLITNAPGYFVMNNDRVIQLASGRIIAPLAFHRARDINSRDAKSFDSRAIAVWQVSDDDGTTWKEAPQWLSLPVPASRTGLQEPGLVQLPDTTLLAFFRTDQGAQFESRSVDGGKTWTPPIAGPMRSPTSPASMKRIPGSDNLLAVWNDHSGQFSFPAGKRSPLAIALSPDGGKTWPIRKLIESDADGWYCYTAIHFVDDAVILAYCAGDSKIGGLNRLRIRRVDFTWLKQTP